MLNLKKILPFNFAVAHVDHRWRSSSSSEAEMLKKIVEGQGILFHLEVLDPKSLEGNLEAACRKARYDFFQSLIQKNGYKGVLLGHHADDQVETVLKRLCEGSQIVNLSAMAPESYQDEMRLWRPFLNIPKQEIVEWLELKKLHAIDDPTNRDPKFLRARCREQIIPWLNERFGKSIAPSFRRLAADAKELSDYLDLRTAPLLEQVVEGPFGWRIDVSQQDLPPAIECRHLLYRFTRSLGIMLSRQELDIAGDLLLSGKANRQLRQGSKAIYIDRGSLFVLRERNLPLSDSWKLENGSIQWGSWQIDVQQVDAAVVQQYLHSDWRSVWKGKICLLLPKGDYYLQNAIPNSLYPGSSTLSKWWGDAKVPTILRQLAPVIVGPNGPVHEFLSGRRVLPTPKLNEINWMLKASTM
jgi:tRNA(Ile)-lysidine synthase